MIKQIPVPEFKEDNEKNKNQITKTSKRVKHAGIYLNTVKHIIKTIFT